MAGTNSGFSAIEFRDAIHFAMNMGMPNTTSERATFYWKTSRDFDKKDSAGLPFGLKSQPLSTSETDPVQVPVAVEFARTNTGGVDGKAAGQFDTSRATITLLDEDYAKVFGADYMKIGGNRYEIDYVTSVGIFDVTVYQIYAHAWDES